ncbi:MAG: hypothetical protein E7504_05810 [Ruminococcus sp.]|nr:hypothetical protein [Ruminococcus sp.]
MKSSKKHVFTNFFAVFSSTKPVLKKSEKVKNEELEIFTVELWRICGVEMEKFLKILWNYLFPDRRISHSVECYFLEKVEIFFITLQYHGICEEIISTYFSTLC